MERAEKVGLGLAAAGHAVLFGLLSVGFLATPNPVKLETKPIDISLVEAVETESAAPADSAPPASSQAPEQGPPEDAPPPVETAPEPRPAPPEAQPEPAPPKPAPAPAPAPPKPAPPKPAPPKSAPVPKPAPKPEPPKPAPAKPAPAKPAPAKPAPTPAKPAATKAAPAKPAAAAPSKSPPAKAASTGNTASATAKRPRGSLLGDDFRKSLAVSETKGQAETPRAAKVSATAVAGLGDAIARQVQPCANRIPNPGPGANQIRSRLRLRMNADGSLAQKPTLVGQTGVDDENGRYAQRVGELAAAAIIQCAPYKLPGDLYKGGWEDIIVNYRLPG